ncbi:syntaxin ASCRUDRAFT_67813 [Ascoidea rubescens DSM 1968]|uniref:t-SNARE coiled-coil homology domain-containing protein n=1 Tax=Ascoidea rubescens DSM 1968 TaxID=1344418 RepID=A0A1D2VQ66_9ASCO|nr:hypothetical protein ASCRUDRAFT_67813 [Ascoidea rubescens DSM 1968]ODV63739.1 hypothetical protein ASCRUDRAFT_67813 [Ascoidea rubescens DSM 1968]
MTNLQLSQITLLIEECNIIIEERNNIKKLNISPSLNDNNDLISILNKILINLRTFENNLIISYTNVNSSSNNNSNYQNLNQLKEEFYAKVFDYNLIIKTLIKQTSDNNNSNNSNNNNLENLDSLINLNDYLFDKKELPIVQNILKKKSVRFKDNLIEDDPVTFNQPYKDSPAKGIYKDNYSRNIDTSTSGTNDNRNSGDNDNYNNNDNELFTDSSSTASLDSSTSSEGFGSIANHQLFAQQQQLLTVQDDRLDSLAESVRRQRELGLTINDELDSQLVILNDVESLMDNSQRRLSKARNNLRRFSRKLKENGQWVLILMLIIVLLLLLLIF